MQKTKRKVQGGESKLEKKKRQLLPAPVDLFYQERGGGDIFLTKVRHTKSGSGFVDVLLQTEETKKTGKAIFKIEGIDAKTVSAYFRELPLAEDNEIEVDEKKRCDDFAKIALFLKSPAGEKIAKRRFEQTYRSLKEQIIKAAEPQYMFLRHSVLVAALRAVIKESQISSKEEEEQEGKERFGGFKTLFEMLSLHYPQRDREAMRYLNAILGAAYEMYVLVSDEGKKATSVTTKELCAWIPKDLHLELHKIVQRKLGREEVRAQLKRRRLHLDGQPIAPAVLDAMDPWDNYGALGKVLSHVDGVFLLDDEVADEPTKAYLCFFDPSVLAWDVKAVEKPEKDTSHKTLVAYAKKFGVNLNSWEGKEERRYHIDETTPETVFVYKNTFVGWVFTY